MAGVLAWGADVVDGIPYAYEDPKKPGTYIGFEVDIGNVIARRLGVRIRLVSKPWDQLIPELQRGSFDMAMNGVEDTNDRKRIVLFSDPYYVYSQQITVRKETQDIHHLEDLKGKVVATLSGTAAEDILRGTPGVKVLANPDIHYGYWQLQERKVDAVLMDTPIAAAYGAPNPKLKPAGESFSEGNYVIAFRKEDRALRNSVNQILETMKRDGELKAIYTKWGLMDDHQRGIGVR
jgi:polar amino acid transport system substrate-binding protein